MGYRGVFGQLSGGPDLQRGKEACLCDAHFHTHSLVTEREDSSGELRFVLCSTTLC